MHAKKAVDTYYHNLETANNAVVLTESTNSYMHLHLICNMLLEKLFIDPNLFSPQQLTSQQLY